MKPLTLKMNDQDNVAIVANPGGLPAGTALANGLVLKDAIPQGHKVALTELPAKSAVVRYGMGWICWPTGLALLWSFLDPDGQFLHDRIAGTQILYEPKPETVKATTA